MTVDRDTTSTQTSVVPVEVWRLSWKVAQHRPKEFWFGAAAFIVFFTIPAATGYFLSRG